MGVVHNSPIYPANKVSSLHWRLQILPVHCLTLQYCYSFFLEFTKVAKDLKLMALAEGISICQYIDGWLMITNSKQQCQGYTHWVVHVVERPGLDHKFLKIRFISNSTNQIYGYNSTSNSMLKASHSSPEKLMLL